MRLALFLTVSLISVLPARAQSVACIPDTKAAADRICDLYTRYGDTKALPFAAEARACAAYYQATFNGFNELCGFHQEAGAFHRRIAEAGKRVADNKNPADQAGLEKAQADLHAEASRVFARNHADLGKALTRVELTYSTYSRALWSSGDYIYSQWARELYCHGGYRSEVPGFWLDAINKAMSRQIKIDHPKTTGALLDAMRVAYLGGRGAEKAAEAARQAAESLGQAAPPEGPPEAGEGDQKKKDPYFHHETTEAPIRLGQEVVTDRAIQRVNRFMPLPGWVKQVLNVGSGVAFYSWKDGFDAGTVLSALVSVFGIAPGVLATVAEVAIRNDFERRKFFRTWLPGHIKANPGISSKQVAENFCKELKAVEDRHREHVEKERAERNARLHAQMQVNAARMKADFECRQRILAEQQKIRQAPAEQRGVMIEDFRRRFPDGRCDRVPH